MNPPAEDIVLKGRKRSGGTRRAGARQESTIRRARPFLSDVGFTTRSNCTVRKSNEQYKDNLEMHITSAPHYSFEVITTISGVQNNSVRTVGPNIGSGCACAPCINQIFSQEKEHKKMHAHLGIKHIFCGQANRQHFNGFFISRATK